MSDLIETEKKDTIQDKSEEAKNAEEKSSHSHLSASDRLFANIAPLVSALGYELVHVETVLHREKVLRLFIDLPAGQQGSVEASEEGSEEEGSRTGVGVQDCVNVTRGLDEPLDAMPELDTLFGGAYELEVSSPGVDRPLRKVEDFERFSGQDVRVHTFRPLTSEEIGDEDYAKQNPKQKNFIGILEGFDSSSQSVKLSVLASKGALGKSSKAPKGKKKEEKKSAIRIPMALISKANIEPRFDLRPKLKLPPQTRRNHDERD
jgi:ribosome maturation factor RimP